MELEQDLIKLSREELQKPVNAVARGKCAAMLLNRCPAPTADWTKSNASSPKASARSNCNTLRIVTVQELTSSRKWVKPGDENESQDNSLESPTYDSFQGDAADGRRGSVQYPASTASEHRPHALCMDCA